MGNISEACKKVGIKCRQTYYDWIANDKDFVEAVKYIDEQRLDFVEGQMFKRIKGYEHKETKVFNYKGKLITKDIIKHYPPDSGLIAFYLETKGQQRGYIRKVINENVNKDPFDGMTEEEIDAMLAQVEAEDKAEAEKEGRFKKVDNNDDL